MPEAALKTTPQGEVREACPPSQEAGPGGLKPHMEKNSPLDVTRWKERRQGTVGSTEKTGLLCGSQSGWLRVTGGCYWGLECLASLMAAEGRQGLSVSAHSGQGNWSWQVH